MTKNKTVIDIHVIQTVPPSCINRDDNNSPKTAIYGGAIRARVSSQAWKKAVRDEFGRNLGEEQLGIRTKYYADIVKMRLLEQGYGEQDAEEHIKVAFEAFGISNVAFRKPNKQLSGGALFFISPAQLDIVTNAALELANPGTTQEDKKKCLDTLRDAKADENNTIDIALFGRMLADNPLLNCDASCRVAHAISVDATENEFDFFSATDDGKKEVKIVEDAGAGHLGTVEYNSSTLYRYATIQVDRLKKNLSANDDATKTAILEFTKAFIKSIPTGKLNTFANNTVPSFVLITIRKDQPINLVSAFENPAKAKDDKSVSEIAVEKLAAEVKKLYGSIVNEPETGYSFVISSEKYVNVANVTAEKKDGKLILHEKSEIKTIEDTFNAEQVTFDELLVEGKDVEGEKFLKQVYTYVDEEAKGQ